jgi:transposase-like protein
MVLNEKTAVTCHSCWIGRRRFGRHRNGLQRYRCQQCRKTFTEPHERPLDPMTTALDKAVQVLSLPVEGCSVRSAERLTGLHRNT